MLLNYIYFYLQGVSYVYEICIHMSDTSSLEVFMVPTNLRYWKILNNINFVR